MGVIGLGRLGGYMARYCKALRMKVHRLEPEPDAGEGAGGGGDDWCRRRNCWRRSDAISIHMVLSDRSRGLIGAADIARMKPGAILINTSRGPIVDEAAMLEAVHAGRIVAALDVYRPRAAAVEPSAAQRAEHGDDAASGLRREGDVGRVLSADDGERAGVSWMASRCG